MMADHRIAGRSGSDQFPIGDHGHQGSHQLSEGVAMYDLRPPSDDDTTLSVEIDRIQDRLARDIPKLQREMDQLLIRVRRPGLD
jgi:hypothetical protein